MGGAAMALRNAAMQIATHGAGVLKADAGRDRERKRHPEQQSNEDEPARKVMQRQHKDL